jgi:alkylation response protein AidB-like acyl-CoA dehydrogenase
MARQPFYIVIAQTDIEKGHKGINAFIVEKKGWSGFDIGKRKENGNSRIGYAFFNVFRCESTKRKRIGEDGVSILLWAF